MSKPRKKPVLVINASIWLKDDLEFTVIENLEHAPGPGEILDIEGQPWLVVEWTDPIECERVVS